MFSKHNLKQKSYASFLLKDRINNSGYYGAVVYQDSVVKRLVERGLNKEEIYDLHWLDVEDIYRKQGWEVEYDKPGYNESYDAYFRFKPKK